MKLQDTYLFAFFMLLLTLTACTKTYPSIEEVDTESVDTYIQSNNLNVQQYNQTGIYYQVIDEGNGDPLDYSQKIPLVYTVKTLDGSFTSVDTFINRYADFFGYFRPDSLREVMMSSGLKQGGSLRVILPSRFAFGQKGSGGIPGNSSVDYTIRAIPTDGLADYEDALINTYMNANNLTGFTKTSSGLYYKIITPGTGTVEITDNSILTLKYTGKLFNGTIFDQTADGATASLLLGNLIQGWREALPMIKSGGHIQLLIPSELGYKLVGGGKIPPFATLYFDVEVTDVL